MKNKAFLFIGLTYLFNIIGFGGIFLTKTNFQDIFLNPLTTFLFVLGGLGSGIVGIYLSKKSISFDFKNLNTLTLLFFVGFLLINTMLFGLFGGVNKINNLSNLLIAILICTLIFGIQEIGWIDLVYEHFYPIRGKFKGFAIIGLLKALSFFPLTLLPGFIINPENFAFFAVYLIGVSGVSMFLRKYSGSIIVSILFIGFLYGIMSFMNFNLEMRLVLIGFILGIIVYALQDLIFPNERNTRKI